MGQTQTAFSIFFTAAFFFAFLTLCFMTGVELAAGVDIPAVLAMSSAQTAWTVANIAIPINKPITFFITLPLYFYSRVSMREP